MEGAPAYVDGTTMEDTPTPDCVSMETTGIVAIVGIIEVPVTLIDCMVITAANCWVQAQKRDEL
jgi:hypothetical protein